MDATTHTNYSKIAESSNICCTTQDFLESVTGNFRSQKDNYYNNYYGYMEESEYHALEILVKFFGSVLMVVGTVGNVLAGMVVVWN